MKKTKAVLAVILAAALCGCSSKEEGSSSSSVVESTSKSSSTTVSSSSSSSSSSTKTSSLTESSSESEPESSEPVTNETFLKGLAGDTILRTDIKQVFVPEGGDASVESLTEENFSSVLCMGFIYVSEPKGVFRTNLDNADVYDDTAMSFTDISDEKDTNYTRLNVGEKMCGMTLTFAETNFARTSEDALGASGSYFCYGSCTFSGETELVGYINVRTEGGSNFAGEGDVIFVPTEGNLPVVNYSLDAEKGICHKLLNGADQNLVWSNEYGCIYLGNIFDNTSLKSFEIPEGSEYIKCKIVVDNVKYMSSTQFYPRTEAELISFELL